MTEKKPDKNHVMSMLRAHMQDLRAQGVLHVYVFGSLARGEQTADSDIDIAVRIDPEYRMGLTGLARLQRQLSNLLGGKIDITILPVCNGRLRQLLEKEAIRAF